MSVVLADRGQRLEVGSWFGATRSYTGLLSRAGLAARVHQGDETVILHNARGRGRGLAGQCQQVRLVVGSSRSYARLFGSHEDPGAGLSSLALRRRGLAPCSHAGLLSRARLATRALRDETHNARGLDRDMNVVIRFGLESTLEGEA